MAALDVYEVSFNQRFVGQTLTNVMFYQQLEDTGETNWAQQLAELVHINFGTDNSSLAFDNLAFSNDLELMSIQVRNLFNPVEIGGLLLGGVMQGANTGTNDTPQTAYRLVSQRKRGDMRNGQKFFGGICNGSAINGIVVPTIVTLLADLAAALSQTLTISAGPIDGSFQPVIVKRVREGAGTGADPYTYRLPESFDEYDGYLADNWVASDVLTTSNRRKIGRGI